MSLHTKTAVILAAGNGSRLARVAGRMPKPLVELHGRPLIEHIMLGAREAGIERFVIVAGYRAEAVREWAQCERLCGIEIDVVENHEYKTKANGVSLLKARQVITESFLLLMSDHLFDSETAAKLLRQPIANDEVILAVDRKLDSIFDMDDATKVLCNPTGQIVAIGKMLPVYNAVDTGMFLCTPAIFSALEFATVNGDCSLSDGMRLLGQQGKFRAFDIGDGMWQDVDTPEALAYAEAMFGARYLTSATAPDVAYA